MSKSGLVKVNHLLFAEFFIELIENHLKMTAQIEMFFSKFLSLLV